ncbi:hypothetical protein D3C78_384990 [compost metagenome]
MEFWGSDRKTKSPALCGVFLHKNHLTTFSHLLFSHSQKAANSLGTPMNESTWVTYLTAIGAIATPLLLAIFGGIGWRFRTHLERKLELENKLRDHRIEIYNQILEPFIVIFMTDAAWQMDPKNKGKDKFKIGVAQALSLEYRKQAFRLALVGSDGVVKAYNDLMQSFYNSEDDNSSATEEKAKNMISLVGKLLLEIRKSMGNESTDLDKWSMLEWFISDARKYRNTAV